MHHSEYVNYDAAIAAVKKATTARMRHLEMLRAYVEGTQYAGKPDWFSSEQPLWERAPCVVYPIAKSAIDSNVDLVLGSQTFPTLSVPVSHEDLGEGFDQEESELLNRWFVELIEYARLRPVCRELFANGQGSGSAVAIVGLRGGKPVVDTTRAAWCTPEIDADGAVLSLVIEYPYLQQSKQPDGLWRVDAMLYRRVVDTKQDITYAPAKLQDGSTPNWQPKTVIEHGLGFCPVVWYPHQKGCTTIAEVDGKAIHCHLLDEITALDFTLSQRHRAALYAGDPQWTETGVEPGFNPSSGGRAPMLAPSSVLGGATGPENPVNGGFLYSPHGRVRKKSPGDVWQYENENAKITLHSLPGDALTSLDNHAKDLKSKICESLGVSFLDPENVPRGGEISSTAIKALRARQFDRCDSYRSDFGDLCLRPLVGMIVRVLLTRPAGLKMPGFQNVIPLLQKMQERGLLLRLNWGAYLRPDPAEELALIQAAAAALEAGLATVRSAVMMAQDVLAIEDVEEHLAALEQQAMQRKQEAVDALAMQEKPASMPMDEAEE